jgi:membrane protease YdiL (CAAX protease family)
MRGHAWIAWIVIIALCAYVVARNFTSEAAPALSGTVSDKGKSNLVMVLTGAVLLLTAGGGLLLLIAWSVFVSVGKLRLRVHAYPRFGAIYAETFAVWLLLFVGLSFFLVKIPAGSIRPLLTALAMLLSLSALAWPVLCGVRWRRVRHDIGLHTGEAAWMELLCGVGCYAAALSLAFAGALVTISVMALQKKVAPGSPVAPPTHPAVNAVVNANWWGRLQVIFAAAVAAPIVEETMFRGVLYRHLREAGYRWGRVASIVAGTIVTSFVFAAIHPQGWLGIPPLMGLATVFTLTREWRGSLLPSMVAHALNNAVATGVAIAAYG